MIAILASFHFDVKDVDLPTKCILIPSIENLNVVGEKQKKVALKKETELQQKNFFSTFGFEKEDDDNEDYELEDEENIEDVEEKGSDVEMEDKYVETENHLETVEDLKKDDIVEKRKILENIVKKVIPRLRQSLQPTV